MEDSLVSSDETDAGFYSANEELTEEETEFSPEGLQQLSPTPMYQPVVLLSPLSPSAAVRNYDRLVAKYLELAQQPLRAEDPFSIVDFDEMLEILKLSPDLSSLQVAAHILCLATEVWARQVEAVKRRANSQAEEIVRQNKNRKRRRDDQEEAEIQAQQRGMQDMPCSPTRGNGDQGAELEPRRLTQDSGFGSFQCSPGQSLLFQSSPETETVDVLHKSKRPRLSRLKVNSEGKFIADENSIIFEVNAASTDVISRRKLLHMKFQELASDSFYCDFNIHNEYRSELSSVVEVNKANEANADAGKLFSWIYDNYKKHPPGGMDQLPFFDYGIHNYEESENAADDFESFDLADHNEGLDENVANPDPESENVQPFQLEMPLLELQETFTENSPTESSILTEIDKTLNNSLRKERGPLAPLNMLENIEELSREAKRAISETFENLDLSFLLVDRQRDSGCHFPDIEAITSELPDLECYNNDNDIELTMLDMDVDMSEAGPRAPSPLFDESGASTKSFQRPPLINVKEVIKTLEDTAEVELGTNEREEIPFLELILKSKLNVSSKSDDSTVSVAMTFLGSLHMAHSRKFYLVPGDDDMFSITKRRPEIENFEMPLEHLEKRRKRGINNCDDKRINHQRED